MACPSSVRIRSGVALAEMAPCTPSTEDHKPQRERDQIGDDGKAV
jgi:hypothetical protein